MTHIVRSALLLWCAILLAACGQLPAPAEQSSLPEQPAALASCPAAPACPPCPALAACPPPKPVPAEARYAETAWQELPGWARTALAPSLRAFLTGCTRLQAQPQWQAICDEARAVGAEDEQAARAFFESRFVAYRIIAPDGGSEGMITGYYEPVLKGARAPSATYRHPVLAVPEDLIVVDLAEQHPELRNLRLRGRLNGRRLVPYYSRAEIESLGPDLVAKPLAWVADPVELFFLQIQGSGQIELPSGERFRAGYGDQNGHAYRSLGRYLIDQGELKLEQSSMQGIKAWAAANPGKLQAALNHNASYVFFRELAAEGGPPGAFGVPLTGGYSIAVDPRYVPLGAPVFLATTFPLSSQPLERLMAAQDTGGAIRGAVRADFFWGTGIEAGAQAGRMRQQGRMWLLWPRGAALPPRS